MALSKKQEEQEEQEKRASNIQSARAVANDYELAEGVFAIGARYHVRTPSYQYRGVLSLVTPTVLVFKTGTTETVYQTGPYPAFYAGGGTRCERHEGAFEMVVDRAGTVLHRVPDEKK